FGVVELLNTTVLVAVYPLMSRYQGHGETFGFMVGKLAFFTAAISIPLALTFAIFADAITIPLFGTDFRPTADVLRLLIVYAAASMTGNVFAQGLLVQNRQRRLLGVRASGLALNIVLNTLLIPRLGVVGAAVASLCAEMLVFFALSGSFHAAGWDWRRGAINLVRLLALGGVVALVMVFVGGVSVDGGLHELRPALGIVVGLALYAVGLPRVLAADDWDLLYRLVAAMPGGGVVRRYWKRETVVNW
ncbi:MAG: polysaccharide biosynthesis C-terminal domain-containing protein, partial [Anaerolineae bacterium]|nr:polysaccharide biosynthesis C-terminal domain-containing protein [Anaerolineae bacterium]